MSMFKKASRSQQKLRLALMGPAGSGKTMTALRVARALVGPDGRIAVIDTEHGSAAKYADHRDADGNLLEFDHLDMGAVFGGFAPMDYVKAIKAASAEGYDAIIVDSASHAWNGKGGILAEADRMGGQFKNWAKLTPIHQEFIDAIVGCKTHIICTMRVKTEYLTGKDERTGKSTVEKVGVGAVQRDGMEYEFDVIGDIDVDTHRVRITKSRCPGLADQVFTKPGRELAEPLRAWLMEGTAPAAQPAQPAAQPAAQAQRPVPAQAAGQVNPMLAGGLTEVALDALCQFKGWPNWRNWPTGDRAKCASENDLPALAAEATKAFVGRLHAVLPKVPTKAEVGADHWEEAKAVWAAYKRAFLLATYGVDSATELTAEHAGGPKGLLWLRDAKAVMAAWDAAAAGADVDVAGGVA